AFLLAGVGLYVWTHRPATLEVRAGFPIASVSVYVDGKGKVGSTPATITLPADRYNVVFRDDEKNFEDDELPVEFRPGETMVYAPRFPHPITPEGERILKEEEDKWQALHHAAPVPAPDMAGMTRGRPVQRGGPDATIDLFLPRGDVRPSDLDVVSLQYSAEFDMNGRVEFHRGAELLGSIESAAFPNTRFNWVPVPDEVRKKVRVGDSLTWGWYPASRDAAPKTVSLRVVDPSTA